jgi:hypothetical protein
MPAECAVLRAHTRLEFVAVLAARVPPRAIDAPPVPREPALGVRIDVLAAAQIQQLAFERALGFPVRSDPADLASENDDD